MIDNIIKEIQLRKNVAFWNTFNRCVFVEDKVLENSNKLGIDSILLSEPDYSCFSKERPLITKWLNTFCDKNLFAELNKKKLGEMIQHFSEMVIESQGIVQPQIYLTFNSDITEHCMANSDPNRSVHYYPYVYNNPEDVDEELSMGMPIYIVHENEHLMQFALAKKYLGGTDIPQFDQFCLLMGIVFGANAESEGKNLMGEIDEKQQLIYACEPMEILARYKSYNLIRNLSKYVSSKYYDNFSRYLDEELIYENIFVEGKNVQKNFEKTTKQAISTFEENYGNCAKGKNILRKIENLDQTQIYDDFNKIFVSQKQEARERNLDFSPFEKNDNFSF